MQLVGFVIRIYHDARPLNVNEEFDVCLSLHRCISVEKKTN